MSDGEHPEPAPSDVAFEERVRGLAVAGMPPLLPDHADPSVASWIASPTIPGYEIEGELGRGAMGIVHKAQQHSLGNRYVALKLILGGHDAKRFSREAEAVAASKHPNVIEVYECGEAGGHPF